MTEHHDALWRRYRYEGDLAARAELLERYMGLVLHTARRMHAKVGDAVEFDDLVSAGTLGLIQAVDGFDVTRGLAFSTYAMQRIRGAMLDDLRARDWLPRKTRARVRHVQQTTDALRQQLGRRPHPKEVARALHVDLDAYWREWAHLESSPIVSLDGATHGSAPTGARLEETIPDPAALDPDASLVSAEGMQRLRHAIAALPPRERTVLTLYYYEDLTLRQIGEVLHVTESRICQIRARALRRLRERTELVEAVA